MKIIGFETGAVNIQLTGEDCEALATALAAVSAGGPQPLSDALRVCARVLAMQHRRALVRHRLANLPVPVAPRSRAIVTVD